MARSLKKSPAAVIHIWLTVEIGDEGIGYGGPSVSLGPEWRLCIFKLTDFKTESSKVKQRTISSYDKIRSISWDVAGDTGSGAKLFAPDGR